jgi:hypothetical protein
VQVISANEEISIDEARAAHVVRACLIASLTIPAASRQIAGMNAELLPLKEGAPLISMKVDSQAECQLPGPSLCRLHLGTGREPVDAATPAQVGRLMYWHIRATWD